MSRVPDFDSVVSAWLDERSGGDSAKFVASAVEQVGRTPQRGARRVALEDMAARFSPLSAAFGVAAVLILALVAFQLAGATPGGSVESPSITPTVDLSAMVITAQNVADIPTQYRRLTVYRTVTGIDALSASETAPVTSPGFVDAVLTYFDDDEEHSGEHEGRYATFAAEFASAQEAHLAFEAAVAHHEAPDGWGMTEPAKNPGLGDEGVYYEQGRDYGFPLLSVYLWRVDTVLLYAVDYHPYDRTTAFLRWIAHSMDARAQGIPDDDPGPGS
jgi:hypothetical protein